jgi:phage tail sheath gpL-like
MDFNEIPSDWLSPDVLIEIDPDYSTLGVMPYPQKVLLICPRLPAGTLQPGQFAQITRADQLVAYLGLGSIGSELAAAFLKVNKTTPLFITAIDPDAGAVKSAGTFTITGNLSIATVLRFKVAGRPIRFTALPTDTVAMMATKLAAAINADTANVVTAAAALGVVTCTARYGGELGNGIDLRVDLAAQPVPIGLTIVVTSMTGGAGNPAIQPTLDSIANTWYTMVVSPFADVTNMAALAAWLSDRYSATSKLDVQGFVAKRGTFGELTTFGGLTNCPQLSAMGLNRSPSSPWILSAQVCAQAAFNLTNDPARQLQSLVLPDVEAPIPADQFEDTERNLLLNTGISTFEHLDDGTTTISRIITTYTKSNLNVADRAWLDIMVPATMSRIRYDWAAYIKLMYPRSKLVEDDSPAALNGGFGADAGSEGDTSVVTPKRMYASWAGRCKLYGGKVWIQNVSDTVKLSQFQISADDKNRMESVMKVNIAGNLMVFAGSLQFQV